MRAGEWFTLTSLPATYDAMERFSVEDIVLASGVMSLGSGWDALESFRNDTFRWVGGDAILYAVTMRPVVHQVELQVEPGPGVGSKPFMLAVDDAVFGTQLVSWEVRGRQTVVVPLPVGEPKVHKLLLHTADGGKTAAHDSRVLNFRVFRASLKAMPPDVVKPGAGFVVGANWYPLETYRGQSFRWVNNDAVIMVSAEANSPLELELEPGPGLESKPFVLTVLDEEGNLVGKADVKTRERVSVAYPRAPGRATWLRLHVDGGGRKSPHDSRVMNFRVFQSQVDLAFA